jgi:hypothetical protein
MRSGRILFSLGSLYIESLFLQVSACLQVNELFTPLAETLRARDIIGLFG